MQGRERKAEPVRRLAVVGNAGGGKTVLSRRLAEVHQLPLTHVDSVQFLPGMVMRPFRESIDILKLVQEQSKWLIDGFGPLDIIEKRFAEADAVVFVDFPLWRHFYWASKRQVQNLWSRRRELPEGCSELSWSHAVKLYKSIWKVHKLMRPELLRIFARDSLVPKMIVINDIQKWNDVYQNGCDSILLSREASTTKGPPSKES